MCEINLKMSVSEHSANDLIKLIVHLHFLLIITFLEFNLKRLKLSFSFLNFQLLSSSDATLWMLLVQQIQLISIEESNLTKIRKLNKKERENFW